MRKIQILCIALGLFINLSACNSNDEVDTPQTPGNELPEKIDNNAQYSSNFLLVSVSKDWNSSVVNKRCAFV